MSRIPAPNSSPPLELDPWSGDDPYEVLGLPRDADRGRVKAAYRALQKRAKRGDELWTKAQVANEALTKPKRRLQVDLFAPEEKRLWWQIVERYGEISFDPVPKEFAPALLRASDLEWGAPADDFAVPPMARVVFSNLLPPLGPVEEEVPFGSEPT